MSGMMSLARWSWCGTKGLTCLALTWAILCPRPADALPITITVGDNDGYGFGLADGAVVPGGKWPDAPDIGQGYDGRSAAEKAATDGSQFTDMYSSFCSSYPLCEASDSATIRFNFLGTLLSAELTIDMGDWESANETFSGDAPSHSRQILADINGVPFVGSGAPGDQGFFFQDGFLNTVVRSVTLSAPQLAAANAAGFVALNFSRNGSYDYVAFDTFQIDGELAPVPEPATLALTGLGLMAIARRLRRSRA